MFASTLMILTMQGVVVFHAKLVCKWHVKSYDRLEKMWEAFFFVTKWDGVQGTTFSF